MADWTPVYTRAWSGTPGLTGLIDAIGTNDGVDAYVNPSPSLVAASQSTTHGTSTAHKAFDHSNTHGTSETHTTDAANSWWQVDFKEYRVVLTRVGLWNRSGYSQHPRTFKIPGSEDGTSWTDLLTVSNPSSADGTWWTGEITSTTPWAYVRVLQTGTNTFGANYLVLGEVEFWGELLEPSGPPDPQKTLIGHEAARVLRQGTYLPVRVGHEAARVLRQGVDVPIRIGHTAIRVLRLYETVPDTPFYLLSVGGRIPITKREPLI